MPTPMERVDRFFELSSRGTTVQRELLAAVTTFATMSYILVVHPLIMSDAGMDRAQVLTITAVVAGVFSILMGLMANLPIAVAPGMGANGLVAYTLILGLGVPWQGALGLVFWSGVVFLVLTLTGIRRLLLDAFPDALRRALTAGIGLFIMFIGLKTAGIVVAAPAPSLVQIGVVTAPTVLLALSGIPIVMGLMARRVPGAIILTIILLTAIGFFIPTATGSLTPMPSAALAQPTGFGDLWLALDFGYLWSHLGIALPAMLSLVFMDLFSSLAAMNALCQRAGLVDDQGAMLKPTEALSADAMAAIGASLAGTSTAICFGESAAGIESGGRTGLVAIFVGLFFFLALYLNPLILIIPAEASAPALVFIGLLMFVEVARIDFSDVITGGAATLTLILMAVTSISDGMAIGLIVYAIAMVITGRARQVHPIAYGLAVVLGAYYVLLPPL
ncbi:MULTISPECIES: NCS2 family permease [Bacteria]|uniref:Transporter n=3 Tax=Micrococcales TaxID=85006 RepID=Q6SKD2_PAEAU|nr:MULTISPECIES: NCS2 family permease [Bacteria]AAS20040.1 transporter [Paenarthrobacter aurescens]AAK50278.1 putative transporter [Pseudomonas sp. ADP]MCY0975499.1 NCS2 family permease [Paenarthrobacter ureafaciens]QBE49601.1 NCS2 family permease [Leucobacter triazinivorans]QOF78270.1 NCS2 family permease [Variovorax sp. 38R]